MTREEASFILANIDRRVCDDELNEALDMAIKALEQESKWTLVSERLPEDSGRYLVSVLDGIDRRTTVVPYHPQSRTWTLTGRMAYWKVMAWMPLPKPYKTESEDKE